MNGKFDKPRGREKSGDWMVGKVLTRARRTVPVVGSCGILDLWGVFFCEAFSECYPNSQEGQKCRNKQGVLNTLFCFLTCTNTVSEDIPGTGCSGLLLHGGIK